MKRTSWAKGLSRNTTLVDNTFLWGLTCLLALLPNGNNICLLSEKTISIETYILDLLSVNNTPPTTDNMFYIVLDIEI